jgi:hypothetical protein
MSATMAVSENVIIPVATAAVTAAVGRFTSDVDTPSASVQVNAECKIDFS